MRAMNHIIKNADQITLQHKARLVFPLVRLESVDSSRRACSPNQFCMGINQQARRKDQAVDPQEDGRLKVQPRNQDRLLRDSICLGPRSRKSIGAQCQAACIKL